MIQHKRVLRASCLLLLSAGMLGVMMWLWSCHCAWTAAHLGSQLEQLPEDELQTHVRRLTSLGDHGLPALCAALNSPRAEIADAADRALREELARWELLSPRQAGRKLSLLSTQLAQQAARPGNLSARRLADLSELLLAWPQSGVREMPLISEQCRRVLEAAAADPHEPKLFAASEAVPLKPVEIDATPVQLMAPEEEPAQQAEYVVLPVPIKADEAAVPTIAASPPPALLPADMSEARPLASARLSEPRAAPVVAQIKEPAVPLEQLNTIPLAQLLHATDKSVARASRAELARRGYPPLEIYLQERLTDPDARVRSQAAESLPAMPGMDARPWLLTLSRDESAEVRLVALTLMATSGESQMLRRVKEMAQTDTDPRVRSQAQRIER